MPIQSKNPATDEVLKTFDPLTDQELEEKLTLAQSTFETWREKSYQDRAVLMNKLADVLKKNKEKYGRTITLEMGKPLNQAIAEVEKCAWACEHYDEKTEGILKKEMIESSASESYVRFDPLGIVLAVMPWNYPFWQVMRFAAPGLMAGNVGILKHASNVPQSALFIEEAFLEAGFPKGAFQTLLLPSSKIESVIQDPRVKAATLTGSEYAGSQVAMQCGKEIKKTVLELGGSDPFIVLDDASLDFTCEVGVTARLQNAGQSCIASKRFIVQEGVYDEFLEKFKAAFEAQVVGDPMDDKTTMGPVSSLEALEEMDKMVQTSVEMGATIATGGKRIGDVGAFYAPTILVGVKKGMPAYGEEFFGPVAVMIKVKNDEEAIKVANDTKFGLSSSIWTTNRDRAHLMIPKIEAGAVFVNGMTKSDPRLPFGGIKKSGYGRELSDYGIKEFVNVKTVWVK